MECEQHTLQTETNRLESIRNVCEHLVVEENDLINLIDETKIEQTEVYKGTANITTKKLLIFY